MSGIEQTLRKNEKELERQFEGVIDVCFNISKSMKSIIQLLHKTFTESLRSLIRGQEYDFSKLNYEVSEMLESFLVSKDITPVYNLNNNIKTSMSRIIMLLEDVENLQYEGLTNLHTRSLRLFSHKQATADLIGQDFQLPTRQFEIEEGLDSGDNQSLKINLNAIDNTSSVSFLSSAKKIDDLDSFKQKSLNRSDYPGSYEDGSPHQLNFKIHSLSKRFKNHDFLNFCFSLSRDPKLGKNFSEGAVNMLGNLCVMLEGIKTNLPDHYMTEISSAATSLSERLSAIAVEPTKVMEGEEIVGNLIFEKTLHEIKEVDDSCLEEDVSRDILIKSSAGDVSRERIGQYGRRGQPGSNLTDEGSDLSREPEVLVEGTLMKKRSKKGLFFTPVEQLVPQTVTSTENCVPKAPQLGKLNQKIEIAGAGLKNVIAKNCKLDVEIMEKNTYLGVLVDRAAMVENQLKKKFLILSNLDEKIEIAEKVKAIFERVSVNFEKIKASNNLEKNIEQLVTEIDLFDSELKQLLKRYKLEEVLEAYTANNGPRGPGIRDRIQLGRGVQKESPIRIEDQSGSKKSTNKPFDRNVQEDKEKGELNEMIKILIDKVTLLLEINTKAENTHSTGKGVVGMRGLSSPPSFLQSFSSNVSQYQPQSNQGQINAKAASHLLKQIRKRKGVLGGAGESGSGQFRSSQKEILSKIADLRPRAMGGGLGARTSSLILEDDRKANKGRFSSTQQHGLEARNYLRDKEMFGQLKQLLFNIIKSTSLMCCSLAAICSCKTKDEKSIIKIKDYISE